MTKKTDLVAVLNEKAGKKIAFQGVDDDIEDVDVIPTGIKPLDYALGIGGIPRGRITDIYGLPSVGKSTICFTLMAQAQKLGLPVAFIDAEYSYTPEYARSFGIETDKVLVIQPDCLEEAAEAIEAIIRAKYGLIVVDSISALVPRALAEADHGKAPMAMQARGIAQMLQKIIAPLSKNNCALVTINQMRINLMAMHPGDKYSITGGFALKFYSSIRMEIKRMKAIMKSEELLGYVVSFKMVKNKLGRPGRVAETPLLFGKGYETEGDLIEMGVGAGIIKQEGAYYIIDELSGKKYHGKEKATLALEGDPELKATLVKALFPQQSQQ